MLADRKSIYFRKDKDKDLISYISKLLTIHDFAEIARGLMRDGIKYREMRHNNSTYAPTPDTHQNNSQNYTPSPSKSFSVPDMELKKKQISKEELRDRLDDF